MSRLKTPFAFNKQGTVIKAQEAVKGQTYYCPCCDIKMVVKEGTRKIKHFSHPVSGTCSREGILHKIAKSLLLKAIEGDIKLQCECDTCHQSYWKTLPKGTFTKAEEEVRVDPFICDIVLYRDNQPALAVEIKNTHGIGKRKAEELSLCWIEVKATSVIDSNTELKPIQARLKPTTCPACKQHQEDPETKKRISNLLSAISVYSIK